MRCSICIIFELLSPYLLSMVIAHGGICALIFKSLVRWVWGLWSVSVFSKNRAMNDYKYDSICFNCVDYYKSFGKAVTPTTKTILRISDLQCPESVYPVWSIISN